METLPAEWRTRTGSSRAWLAAGVTLAGMAALLAAPLSGWIAAPAAIALIPAALWRWRRGRLDGLRLDGSDAAVLAGDARHRGTLRSVFVSPAVIALALKNGQGPSRGWCIFADELAAEDFRRLAARLRQGA